MLTAVWYKSTLFKRTYCYQY